MSDWINNLFTGDILEPKQLQYYLQNHPHKMLGDTLKVLAIEDPHHPPLYYILVRVWRQLFGDSVTVIRSFSVWVSLFFFPAIYWLSWQLFKQPIVSAISVGLIAVSPFYILYAQEAREYALWTVLITLSSASLLKSIELINAQTINLSKSYLMWGIYVILTILSLYTSLFTLFVIIAQIAYTFFLNQFRLTKVSVSLSISLILSVILFTPWISVFIANYERYKLITSWTKEFHFSALYLLKYWGFNLSRIFIDFDLKFNNIFTNFVIIIYLILVLYSLYFLINNTPKKCWLFIIMMMGVQLSCLLIPDIVLGGVRSLSPRYLIPFYIITDVSIAYLLANQLISPQILNTKIWSIITLIVFSVSLLSCINNLQKNTSYTKIISYSLPKVAQIINESNSPLLIGNDTSYNSGNIMALSYLLDSHVKLQLFSHTDNYQLSKEFHTVFLLTVTNKGKETLEQSENIKITEVFRDEHLQLWKVKLLN
ncbi:glycosyltransferase family 39 protein [Crocosphaera chwakensis]|nr:glycosyltransferase family 39 protein [Crocosphaera chwakensis]